MKIRETLQERKEIGAAVAIGALLVAGGAMWYSFAPATSAGPTFPKKLFFSDDDGKTYFIDDSARIAPFDHGGKQAFQAAVFRCGGSQPFVGYLMKFTTAGKSALEALPEAQRRSADPQVMDIKKQNMAVKKPGDDKWVPLDGQHPVGDIVSPACPNGSADLPKQITP